MSDYDLKKLHYKTNKYKYKYSQLKKQLNMYGGDRDYKATTEKIIVNAIYKFNEKYPLFAEQYLEFKDKTTDEKIKFLDEILPAQAEQHTILPDDWKSHIIPSTTKCCDNGIIYKLDIQIPNSAKQIDVNEILDKLHNEKIELNFGWSRGHNLIFLNFISKNADDFTKTEFVFAPKNVPGRQDTKPYAFYQENCPDTLSGVQFYQLLSRKFTTDLIGSWIGKNEEETFNKTYESFDFSKFLPLRNMS
jgi:hypothetical protein